MGGQICFGILETNIMKPVQILTCQLLLLTLSKRYCIIVCKSWILLFLPLLEAGVSVFQSRKRLYNHKCPSICPSSVCKTPQQLDIIILHHSSFILHHPSFISRLLSFSACLQLQCSWKSKPLPSNVKALIHHVTHWNKTHINTFKFL